MGVRVGKKVVLSVSLSKNKVDFYRKGALSVSTYNIEKLKALFIFLFVKRMKMFLLSYFFLRI